MPVTMAHSENSQTESCTEQKSSEFKNHCSSEEGSYLRLIYSCITQL